MRLWLRGGGASRIKIDEVFKGRVQISRAFKGKGITHSVRVRVMLRVMLKLLSECNLCSLSMLELVDKAGR